MRAYKILVAGAVAGSLSVCACVKMAACRKALEEGLQDILLLPNVSEHYLPAAESAVWEKLHTGIRVGKGYQRVVEGHSKEAMRATLEFLVSWKSKRKDLRPRIRESLAILLECPEWLRVAQLEPMHLQRQLLEVFAGNLPMCRKLAEPVQVIIEPNHKPLLEKLLCDSERIEPLRDEIKNKLLVGASTMQKLGWTFPAKQSVGRDTATEAFSTFALAVSRLGVVTQKMEQDAVAEYVDHITKEISLLWPDVLCFLGSICIERRPLVSKIKFVVSKLSEISPSFQSAAKNAQIHASIDSLAEAVRLNTGGCVERASTAGVDARTNAPSSSNASPLLQGKLPQETSESHACLRSMRAELVAVHRRSLQDGHTPSLQLVRGESTQQTPVDECARQGFVSLLCGRRKSKKKLAAREEQVQEVPESLPIELGEGSPIGTVSPRQSPRRSPKVSPRQQVQDDVAEFIGNQPTHGLFRMYT